ncbi:Hsp20/alpha crystallin family protein [Natronobiforma cellulositropha]|uniref:Hsp20/alpha crystallin family protein n=1 Tax=Natronobiforma cellulositropha TaxID=1679076 RepID=UPI0021D587B8|nr:Hsp20/alpha crystallin family protein [Natronobiforma cellulositropha]
MRSFDDMNQLFREMDRMFEQMRTAWWNDLETPRLEAGVGHATGEEYPAVLEGVGAETTVSLEDEGDAYVFVMDLPGFEKEDIDLTFDDGLLSVRAHRDAEEGAETHRATRSRRVARGVTIPKEIVVDEITASYHNGVLEVTLPIVDGQQHTGHRIDIE